MCGYLIYRNLKGIGKNEESNIDNIERDLKVRGPDDKKKILHQNNTLLYFRRLSIIDLDNSANQPFEIDEFLILFNGEVYNHLELKNTFLKDQNFKTNSDTEVVIRLFIKLGVEAFKKLSGIYAITIFNKISDEIIIYRDPFGIKPLYYYRSGNKLIISSQSKIVNKIINNEIDLQSKEIFNFFGNIISNHTIYKNIYSFQQGKVYKFKKNLDLNILSLENIFDQNFFIESTNESNVRESLYHSINENFVSDVEVSVLYSSGYDSNIIVENIPEGNQLKLFTISTEFNNDKQNEIINSKKLNKFHSHTHITHNFKKEEISSLNKFFFNSMDQPTIDGLNTFLVSNLIKKNSIKVALSGVGGDEYFGSYDTFKIIPFLMAFNKIFDSFKLKNFIINILCKVNKFSKLQLLKSYETNLRNLYLIKRGVKSNAIVYKKFIEALEDKKIMNEIDEILNLDCSDFLKISLLELKFYCKDRLLRDVDWAGMANSIEIRVPFLNKDFHKNICTLNKDGKKLSKSDIIKNSNLKKILKNIKKQGFYVPYLSNNQKILNAENYSKFVLENF